MRLGTGCIVLALGWATAAQAQQPTSAIYPLRLDAKAIMESAPATSSGDILAGRRRVLAGADIVRIAGFDARTHVLAVAGNSESMKLVVWDRRQPETAPGTIAAEIGSLNLGNALTVSAASRTPTLALVTATLVVNASAGNRSFLLNSTSVARLASDGAGKLILAPLLGDIGSHGTLQQCRALACANGYLTMVNVQINFQRSIGYIQAPGPAPDSDGDGFTDDVDQCPSAGDEGYGVDPYGCPLSGSQDSDGDGVLDGNDACPAQGDVGYGVDASGCPIMDSDGDGFLDGNDSCPQQGDAGYGVDANGCPNVDSDGDSVFDSVDSCPDRGEEGYGVGPDGCPNPPAPQDYDNDGVTDDVDQCFAEGDTYGYGVYPNGCPIMDSDGDGYADPYDACPDAGDQGTGVDGSGCPNAPG